MRTSSGFVIRITNPFLWHGRILTYGLNTDLHTVKSVWAFRHHTMLTKLRAELDVLEAGTRPNLDDHWNRTRGAAYTADGGASA